MTQRTILTLLIVGLMILPFGSCRRATSPATQQGNSLVVVSPQKGLDYNKLEGLLKIYDHYFEDLKEGLQHRLIGEVESSNLEALKALPLSVEVVDNDTTNKSYYWFSGKDSKIETERQKGTVVYTSGSAVLVAMREKLTARNWPHGLRVVEVDLRPISVVTIDRNHYDKTFERHMMPLPPHVEKKSQVSGIFDELDAGSCEHLLKQLTGEETITVGGSPYTVHTREMCGPDIDPLMDWMAAELTAAGLTVRFDTFTSGACPGKDQHRQLIAEIPGTDLANQLFLVTAHLDAVANTAGADDNASGVVAMICAAKALAKHKFRRTLQFVAFNGEEYGLLGSNDYVDDLLARRTPEICGAFNMDMIAYDNDHDRKFQLQSNPGDAASAFMRDRLAETVTVYGINLVPVLVCDDDNTTDQGAFWDRGKPAILAGEEYFCETHPSPCDWLPDWMGCGDADFNPFWHNPGDTSNKINFDLIMETTKSMIGVMAYAGEIQ
jgi:hypothetical protein